MVLDITERKRLERALAQAQKMEAVGQLAGGIAHDFNNILGAILSFGSFVRDGLPEGDQRRDDVVDVLKAADRAAGLTRQLLAFSRQQPAIRRPTDLNRSLEQIHKLLVRTLGAHIELHVVPSPQATIVNIDPVQFDQVVLNLAVNARDAMSAGGSLQVTLKHAPREGDPGVAGWAALEVTDNGSGMDAQTQQRIFEPFFSTKAHGRGTGLGLATCFGIVTEAGGSISVASAPGEGTTFTVALPLCNASASAAAAEPQHAPGRDGRGKTVLVAEDDSSLRNAMSRILGNAGYTVHLATDGRDAIRKLDALGLRLDVLISDVVMPLHSGWEVAEYAKRVAPNAALVLTSGFVDQAARPSAMQDVPILWKPVAPENVVGAIQAALAARTASSKTSAGAVFVVEDDVAGSNALVRVFKSAGCAVETAASVAEARRALEAGLEPRLLLCDLTLADGSGAELLAWIEQTRPALCPRVFVLTGGACDEAGRGVISSGRFQVLRKPIPPQRLLDLLADAERPPSPPRAGTPTAADPTSPNLPAATPKTSRQPVRRERVLVVDDDASLAAASQRVLADDFEVVVAGSLDAARRALGEGEFDALTLDIQLPDGNGLDLLRELRGRNSELPVVMVTGELSVESATQALRSRANEYLLKPFTPEQLLDTVRAAVAAGRVARVRTQLLAARFGGDEFVKDLRGTEERFGVALSKIRMVFQPIVRAADSSIFGYEALLRCDEPSLATPLRLLAAAEILGRVEDVGRAVRAAVAEAVLAEPDRLEAIFVNIHPSELRADLLAETQDPLLALAQRVVLEVTERASLEAGPKLEAELSRVRELGYRLAVDDLGEGYAGLSSLVHLRPDIAKIDMSLVRDIHRMPLKREIVAGLADMARRSGIVVVAEGIETVDERDALVDLGCDLLQGYLFAKPGPPFPVVSSRFTR